MVLSIKLVLSRNKQYSTKLKPPCDHPKLVYFYCFLVILCSVNVTIMLCIRGIPAIDFGFDIGRSWTAA